MMAWLVGGTVLVNLFVFALGGLSVYQSRFQYQERAEITTQNLARVLDENIAGAIDKIDISLLSAQDEFKRQMAGGRFDAGRFSEYLAQQLDHQPEIVGLRATDAEGVVRYGRGVPATGGPKNNDRDYFIRARDETSPALIISKPLFARIDKKWVVVLGRRLSQPNGSFGGVVYTNVPLAHLSRTFSGVDVGPRGTVALLDADLGLVALFPEPPNVDRIIGGKPSPAVREQVVSRQGTGTYRAMAPLDDIERTYSYRRIDDKPFYIVVGIAVEDYLSVWRTEALKTAALVSAFFLATLIMSWLIHRSWRRQRVATDALIAQEAKFRTVADYTYDWEYWQGPHQEVLYMSPSCERITGYTPAEFIADPDLLQRIVFQDDRSIVDAHRKNDLHHDEALVDFRIVRRDGGIRWITHGCRAVFGPDGQFLGRRVSNRDNTERILAERELNRSNRELEQFSYTISHDMRQPLRMISSYLQLIERSLGGQLEGERREYFHFAIDGARRLDDMMVALLEYSRVGRKGEPPMWIESRALLDEALLFLQPAIAEAQANPRIEGVWPRVFVSRDEMTRLLQNLIGNALKFRVAGRTPEIVISSETVGNEWRFAVADNGVGFAPDQAGRLFQVFQRLQPRSAYEGTGIGLALCRKIVERHGGSIQGESAGENTGSRFRCVIPLPDETSASAKESP